MKTSSCCAVFTDVTSLPCVIPRSSCTGPRGKPGNIGPPCVLSHGPGRDWVPLPGYSAKPGERHREESKEDGGCPPCFLWGTRTVQRSGFPSALNSVQVSKGLRGRDRTTGSLKRSLMTGVFTKHGQRTEKPFQIVSWATNITKRRLGSRRAAW